MATRNSQASPKINEIISGPKLGDDETTIEEIENVFISLAEQLFALKPPEIGLLSVFSFGHVQRFYGFSNHFCYHFHFFRFRFNSLKYYEKS